MNKKFFSFFFILLISLISASASWDQAFYNVINLNKNPISASLLYNEADFLQNITTGTASYSSVYQNSILLSDVDSDGNDELIVNDNSILKFYDYSDNSFSIEKAYPLSFNPTTSFIYYAENGKDLLIAADESNIYFLDLSAYPDVSLAATKALSNPRPYNLGSAGKYYNFISPKCYASVLGDYCILKENTTQIEVFNISDVSSIASFNFSDGGLISNESSSYWQPLISGNEAVDITKPQIIAFCSNNSRIGIALYNLSNGVATKRNCSLMPNSLFPAGHISEYDLNSDGLDDYIFMVSAGGGSFNISAVNVNLNNLAGFPYGMGAIGLREKGYSIIDDHIVAAYDLTGTYTLNFISSTGSAAAKTSGYGTAADVYSDAVTTGNDFVLAEGMLYDYSNNNWINLTNDANREKHYGIASVYDADFLIFDVWQNAVSVFGKSYAYPNNTIIFRHNITGDSIGSVYYSIYNLTGSLKIAETTAADSTRYIGEVLPFGEFSMNVSKSGFLPYNHLFNNSKGTNDIYFYLQPNLSSTATLIINFWDSSTYNLVTDEVQYSINWYNDTTKTWLSCSEILSGAGCGTTTTGSVTFSDVPIGNYSITAASENYNNMPNAKVYVTGSYDVGLWLDPMGQISGYQPAVKYIKWYTLTQKLPANPAEVVTYFTEDGNFTGSSIPLLENVITENPATICKGQRVYFNISVGKLDNEAVGLAAYYNFFTGSDRADFVMQNPVLSENGISYEAIFTALTKIYDYEGEEGVFAWSWSASYNYANNPELAQSMGLAKTINFTILNCSGVNLTNNGDALMFSYAPENLDRSDTSLASSFMGLFSGFGVKDTATKLLIGIIFFTIFVLGISAGVAFSIAKVSPASTERIFIVTAGISAVVGSILFSMVFPLLPLYVSALFGIAGLASIVLSIAGFFQSSGG